MKKLFSIKKTAIYFFGLCIIIASCKEGKGGKASVSGYVKHHEKPIPNAVVYIKYDAVDLPGTEPSDFNTSVFADETGFYEIKNLRRGDYYLYGVGIDDAGPYIVKGGVGAKLRTNENTPLDVAVTEE